MMHGHMNLKFTCYVSCPMGATYPDQYTLFDFNVPADQCLVKTGPTYYDSILLCIFSKPSHSLQIRPTISIRTKFHRHPLTADAIHGPSVHVPFFNSFKECKKPQTLHVPR